MKRLVIAAVVLGLTGAGAVSTAAWADDPRDPHKICVVFPTHESPLTPDGYCIWTHDAVDQLSR